jgi:flagellar FliJ protein
MFQFRLQTVLRLRLAERDQRRNELAKALRAEEVLLAEEQSLVDQQAAAAARARELKSPGAADVDALLQIHRYEIVLAAQRRQLAQQIVQVQQETERRRLVLVEADRGVRVLEKLRERKAAAWRVETDRHEVKRLDEMAVLGYVRRQEAHA